MSKTTTDFDVLVGGTPCQGFSVAGLRAGLRDERSNLSLEFVRILIDKRPEWFVWENVPGVLTTGAGKADDEEGEDSEESGSSSDFAYLLSAFTGRDIADQAFEKEGIIEGEFYSIAWRILDSRWFGVPQRRRRIFVVGHLGKDWRPPFAVLFEQDSLRRDFTPGGKKRESAAGNTQGSIGDNSYGGYRQRGFGDYVGDQSASTLKKRDYKDATDLVIENVSKETTVPCLTKQLSEQSGQDLGATGALVVANAEDKPIVKNGGGNIVGAIKAQEGMHNQNFLLSKENGDGNDRITDTLTVGANQTTGRPGDIALHNKTLIRRLTPKECGRLQGFPDGYLEQVPGFSDAKAYSAFGNSMTRQVMGWIGKRIDLVDRTMKELKATQSKDNR